MRIQLKKVVKWSLFIVVVLTCMFCYSVVLLPGANSRPFTLVAQNDGNDEELNPRNTNKRVSFAKWVPRFRNATTENNVLWPDARFYNNDRIVNQLRYQPDDQANLQLPLSDVPLKKILLNSGFGLANVKGGRDTFLKQKCPVNTCELTDNRHQADTVDAILFHQKAVQPWMARPHHQIWILSMLESPYHTSNWSLFDGVFNWTATYRHDSDIVTPYEKFVPFDKNVTFLPQNKNYAVGKTKQVAWFVSNCLAKNTRMEYAEELGRYIDTDVYGKCGPLHCPLRDANCLKMLNRDYKFYLSFENSNCRDYITEKFYLNGLQHDVIPIVMGGAPEDYARAAPPHSYIHVDDFESPGKLAQYLHKLDQNDDLYNEYFRWKNTGTFINTFFWCRICAMLHETSRKSTFYRDLDTWWRGDGICIGKESWRKRPRKSKFIAQGFLDGEQ